MSIKDKNEDKWFKVRKDLSFYSTISKLKFPKSYTGKIFLIAFIGTHIPLITLFVYLIFMFPIENRIPVLLVLLGATLVGTAATLYFIYRLLIPILVTSEGIKKYRDEKVLPSLPMEYKDEVGLLMSNTQKCIERLDDLLKLKNRLIGMVSHDSKTPIGSIKIASGLIAEDIEEESSNVDEIKKYLELIEVSLESHSEFLDNMLTLARFDEGEIPANKTKVSPDTFFKLLKDNHKIYFQTKNIKFNTESNLGEKETVYCDKDKMMAVLNNLIQNALKFTESGGSIKLKIDQDDQNYIFKVKDSGVGISDKQKETLFEAFSASSKGTKDEIGSGLGLWIVKVFTEVNGGKVNFESREGEGTEFTIRLPLN